MSAQVALVLSFGLILWLFARDVKRRPAVSNASWLVWLWAVIYASRPVSTWFQVEATSASLDAYMEGSPTDRAAFLFLILAGVCVLLRRRISPSATIRQNRWLFAFYAYCALSILWSDYPFVAFKRLFKDFGNVVMVLVLLTDRDPIEATKAVIVRCAYLLVPLSFLFIRYYPELGRVYTGYSQNDRMYVGVTTHKNALGALLLVSIIFLAWDLIRRKQSTGSQGRNLFGWADGALALGMSFYLLLVANSVTSLVCTILGLGLFFVTGTAVVKRNLRFVEVYLVAGLTLWLVLDPMLNISGRFVTSLGRDLTLTSRTSTWDLVLSQETNPIIGAGFKTFWAGDRMARLWKELPGVVQAHNGYIETFLEGGVIELLFLAALLASSFRRIKRHLSTGEDFARVRFALLAVVIVYNFSEAAFTQLSLLWVVTLLVVAENPQPERVFSPAVALNNRPRVAANPVPRISSRFVQPLGRKSG